MSEIIKNKVEAECVEGNFPLILGGDHCIAIGVLSAILGKRPETAVGK